MATVAMRPQLGYTIQKGSRSIHQVLPRTIFTWSMTFYYLFSSFAGNVYIADSGNYRIRKVTVAAATTRYLCHTSFTHSVLTR